jgi:hypothetical protein
MFYLEREKNQNLPNYNSLECFNEYYELDETNKIEFIEEVFELNHQENLVIKKKEEPYKKINAPFLMETTFVHNDLDSKNQSYNDEISELSETKLQIDVLTSDFISERTPKKKLKDTLSSSTTPNRTEKRNSGLSLPEDGNKKRNSIAIKDDKKKR